MTIGHIEIKPITWLLIVYLLLAIATAILRYFMYIYLQIGANRVIQKLRKDVFEHIQTLPIQYFDNLPAGKIVARNKRYRGSSEFICTGSIQFCDELHFYFWGVYSALYFKLENGNACFNHDSNCLCMDDFISKICL